MATTNECLVESSTRRVNLPVPIHICIYQLPYQVRTATSEPGSDGRNLCSSVAPCLMQSLNDHISVPIPASVCADDG